MTKINKKLTLVGAGPGDPGLITAKGIEAIANAKVILYDALVHPDLLQYAHKDAIKVFVGKRAGAHKYAQDAINKLIVEYALSKGDVIRLKGGDPFIFGRGKEEIEYAESFGIETAVVLGVSSINLPGYYGIPLTRRGVNESFWVMTAVKSDGSLSADLNLAAQSTATVVLFMGLKRINEIVEVYKSHYRENLPAAVISKGSWEDGQMILGTVDTIAAKIAAEKILTPAIIVIGEAVGTHKEFQEKVKRFLEGLDPENLSTKAE